MDLKEEVKWYMYEKQGREGKLKPPTDNYIMVYAWLAILCNSCRYSAGCNLLPLGISDVR